MPYTSPVSGRTPTQASWDTGGAYTGVDVANGVYRHRLASPITVAGR